MSKLSFLFLSILYVTVSILSFSKGIDLNTQLLCCSLFIAVFGIPHGSIDHLLFINTSNISSLKFYSNYIALMIGYLIAWYYFPLFSLLLFMILSAYHFGESQLSKYFKKNVTKSALVYLAWGVNILSALVVFNNNEIYTIFTTYPDLQSLVPVFDMNANLFLMLTSLLVILTSGLVAAYKKSIGLEDLFKEAFVVIIIYLAFVVLPLLPAFTIYFVILHSIGVLLEEFKFLKVELEHMTVINFIKQLLPFTLLSFVGALLMLLLIEYNILNVSYVLLSVILISLVTLPHSIVMYRFYNSNNI